MHGRGQSLVLLRGQTGVLPGRDSQAGDDERNEETGGRYVQSKQLQIVPIPHGRGQECDGYGQIGQPPEGVWEGVALDAARSCVRAGLEIGGQSESQPGSRIEDSGETAGVLYSTAWLGFAL